MFIAAILFKVLINIKRFLFFIHIARKNKDKKSILNIDSNDFINYVKVSYENYIHGINFRTYQGKTLNCVGSDQTENKIEIFEANKERTVNLLGFVIGSSERINSIQFYYEKKLV